MVCVVGDVDPTTPRSESSEMEEFMSWIIPGVLVLVLVVLGGVFRWIQIRGRRVLEEMRAEYGDQLRLISGCGLVMGANRVPGVLALLPERIVYRSAVGRFNGEIMAFLITGFTLTPIQACKDRQVRKYRKYRNSMVLHVACGSPCPTFILSREEGARWHSALKILLS